MISLWRVLHTHGFGGARMLAGPLLILMVLAMMILPLPAFVLDLFFTFNIALSVMILLMAMFTRRPLDFAAFPSVLLLATLLRLSLNVASTRIILLNGHNGPAAAGKVIEAFGQFLVGGNFAVGVIVFIILVIINFVVITKGAGRIAEVGARFTLDAMPGKQMAIDADLNAGLINEADARRRRREIAQEAEFYGAMDGASKFVRGDAVAGLLIMVINIVGGLIVGVMQRGMPVADAASIYTLLTIGDGLVAQIPALVISTAAGIVVSRVADDEDIGQQILGQLFSNPRVMFLTAGILAWMGLIPNMPHVAFLFLALVLGAAGWALHKRQILDEEATGAQNHQQSVTQQATDASWEDVQSLDVLSLEVGYRLIPMVDTQQNAELLHRIRSIRKKFAQEIGFLPPVVHIRDNLEMTPNAYRILLLGVPIGEGETFVDQWLAIDPGGVTETIEGVATQDPAFGLPAWWVKAEHCEQAQLAGYTVVDAPTVVATHLNHLMRSHAAELLGRQETQALIEHAGRDLPKLAEDLVPKILSLAQVQYLLRGLLKEEVPIRDMRSILETMTEHATAASAGQGPAGGSPDLDEMLAELRKALGRAIVQQWFGQTRELPAIGLDPKLERVLLQALGNAAGIEPGLAEGLLREADRAVHAQEARGQAAVLIATPALRAMLARFLRLHLPQLAVLSSAEVPEASVIKIVETIGQGLSPAASS